MAKTTILEEPLREFCKTLVNLDDRYGINCCFWFAKEEITFPSALKLAFICFASSSRVPLNDIIKSRSLLRSGAPYSLRSC